MEMRAQMTKTGKARCGRPTPAARRQGNWKRARKYLPVYYRSPVATLPLGNEDEASDRWVADLVDDGD